MAWRFDWLRSWDDVWEPRHLARWQAACDDPKAHATPFMHPDLVRAWLATMGGPAGFAPFFLHATHADGQQVLWMLVRPRTDWRDGLLRRLLPVGDGTGGPHFAYNDPLVVTARSAEEALAPGFWPAFERELRARGGSWFDSVALHRLRREVAGAAAGEPVSQSSPCVRLDAYPDFHAYMAARPSSLLKRIERKSRKIGSEGRAEFHMHGPDEREAVLGWLPDLEAAQSARYPETVLAPGLLENIVTEGMRGGLVRCSVFRLDGRPISWRVDYLLSGTLYLGFCAIDGKHGRHSPGHLHAYSCLEWHMARGGTAYDLLIGEQAYKHDWTDGAENRLRRVRFESRAPATVARRSAARGLGQVRRLGERAIAAVARQG
jgi:CelD/BcsL family acetyltransferase involved in cellulose biosynthesis